MLEVPKNLRAGFVSIGMPLYNGAGFLRGALDAILAQDYPDFEVLISDNASEDDTGAICQAYASVDPRIKYFRVDRNRGPGWNFTRVYELARGEYFMWAAHDDFRAPKYLSRAVAALEENPHALFCATGVKFIDVEGRDVTDTFAARVLHPVGATPIERLRALARSTYWVDLYSLFRTQSLAPMLPVPEVWGGDVLFIGALCLRGEVVEVPEQLLSYRLFLDKSAQQMAQTLNVEVSWLHLTQGMLKTIWRAPLGFTEKIRIAWMFVIEFCVRNQTVNGHIHQEGFSGVRDAFARKHTGRALALAALGIILFTPAYLRRTWTAAGGRFNHE